MRSHQGLELGIELALVERGHGYLPAVVLPVAHRAHDLRGVVRRPAPDVGVARLQPGPPVGVIRPDDQDAQHLAVGAAALVHVFEDIGVIFLRGLVVNLDDLVDPDDGARRVDLDGREREHRALPRHPALPAHHHAPDHAHGGDAVVRPLDRHRDPQHQHTIELEGPVCLLQGRDLAEAVVGTLVAGEPDVQDGILVRIVAHAPVTHGLVQLLRKGVFRNAQVVWQVPEVQAPVLA
mmetsp:Transcript_7235/g.20256  ORF Transcript_7235/g.20256 Transcript_7235/m.20256 type:complete len:236 (+) Transcript_7235:539-1246(+)